MARLEMSGKPAGEKEAADEQPGIAMNARRPVDGLF